VARPTWLIEGCPGIGKHVASRLLTDGEDVVDVPPRLSASARVFATGQGRIDDSGLVIRISTMTHSTRPKGVDEPA
jgi:hypothetical protein